MFVCDKIYYCIYAVVWEGVLDGEEEKKNLKTLKCQKCRPAKMGFKWSLNRMFCVSMLYTTIKHRNSKYFFLYIECSLLVYMYAWVDVSFVAEWNVYIHPRWVERLIKINIFWVIRKFNFFLQQFSFYTLKMQSDSLFAFKWSIFFFLFYQQ